MPGGRDALRCRPRRVCSLLSSRTWARTSSSVSRPPTAGRRTRRRSTPSSRANRRTAGPRCRRLKSHRRGHRPRVAVAAFFWGRRFRRCCRSSCGLGLVHWLRGGSWLRCCRGRFGAASAFGSSVLRWGTGSLRRVHQKVRVLESLRRRQAYRPRLPTF